MRLRYKRYASRLVRFSLGAVFLAHVGCALYIKGKVMVRQSHVTVRVDGRLIPDSRLYRDINGDLFLPSNLPDFSQKTVGSPANSYSDEQWVYFIDKRNERVIVGNRSNYTEFGGLLFIHHQDQVGMVLGSAKSECDPRLVIEDKTLSFSTQDNHRISIQTSRGS